MTSMKSPSSSSAPLPGALCISSFVEYYSHSWLYQNAEQWLHMASLPTSSLPGQLTVWPGIKRWAGPIFDVLSWEFELWNTERLEQLAEVM